MRKHKYLEGVLSKDYLTNGMCVPNASIAAGYSTKKRKKKLKKQRKKYGFDERETWSMDFTLACWIYERFKWYEKHAPVDLTCHKFDIEVLVKDDPIEVEEKTVTQEQAIEYVFKYFEYYFKHDEDKEFIYYDYAMRIVTKIMPAMWW